MTEWSFEERLRRNPMPTQREDNENYRIVSRNIDAVDAILKKVYSEMNDYFENILNAPSTINRVIKYYHLGFNPGEPDSRYIMFVGGKIIREYHIEFRIESKKIHPQLRKEILE